MVRSVMAVLALTIFPGLAAGQELALEDADRATLEAVVYFDFDESTITPESEETLRAKLSLLGSSPDFRLRLEGHADERGSIEYNLALGSRRAESVQAFLAELGIESERLTTTSFGEERPAVDGSDAASFAQNRRVEFVITGVPDPTLVADLDPPTPEVADPAIVGDVVLVEPPPEPEPEPVVVARRVNPERNRRSRFFPSPSAVESSETASGVDEVWVSRRSTWAAEWLGPMVEEGVEADGVVTEILSQGELRTAFPFTTVRLDLNPGFRVGLGDELQIFRPAHVNAEEGVVLRPMGVLSVTRIAPNAVEGRVDETYGFVRVGDLVRPAPTYDIQPGQVPDRVSNRTEATVIEFGQLHQLYGPRQVTILDQGAQNGVDVGDEYVAFFGDGSTEDVVGRLRVVLTEQETSSAEIVTLEGPVFVVGTNVYLDRKMR